MRQVGVRLSGFVAGVGTGARSWGGRGIAGAGYDPVVARAVPTAIDSPGDFRIGGGVPGVGKG